jgi:DNA invertase Pin-like site-specific DNA recombinase
MKTAAIWARVSTSEQTSLPDQVARARERLEKEGYYIPNDRVLAVDWTSLELFDCPEFQRLRQWVKSKEIQAIGLLERDRLECKGLQRLIFLSECKEADVKLVICQGPELLDGPEGQLVELALAIGKERSVLRAGEGARTGMHDKVVNDHKPTSKHKLYGYSWDGDNKLIPNKDWTSLKLICDLALQGKTYGQICNVLWEKSIPSPSGLPRWNINGISAIMQNPTYTGRYYALKKSAVAPVKRKVKSYGNSSARRLPLNECHLVEDIKIVDPPLTWDERTQILDMAARNRKTSKRNANREYLLRGMIFCGTHRGSKGEPRVYHGHRYGDSYGYCCPVFGCPSPFVDGPTIEQIVKDLVTDLFNRRLGSEFFIRNGAEVRPMLETEALELRKESEHILNKLTRLEARFLDGKIVAGVYENLSVEFTERKEAIQKRLSQIEKELYNLSQSQKAEQSLEQIKSQVIGSLNRQDNTTWRAVLSKLNLMVMTANAEDIEAIKDYEAETSPIPTGRPMVIEFTNKEPVIIWKEKNKHKRGETLFKFNIDIPLNTTSDSTIALAEASLGSGVVR